MISVRLARQLLNAGVLWTPHAGDRFVVADRDMDEEVFWISDMTIEVHNFSDGRILGFNGTTEWALDSLAVTDVVWLPREGQLRDLLGERFDQLSRLPDGGWQVVLDSGHDFIDADAEVAYGLAVLWVAAQHMDEPDPRV